MRADSWNCTPMVLLLGTWLRGCKERPGFTFIIQTHKRRLRDGYSRTGVIVTAFSGALGCVRIQKCPMGIWALSHQREKTSVAHCLLAPYSALCQLRLIVVATVELVGQSVVA